VASKSYIRHYCGGSDIIKDPPLQKKVVYAPMMPWEKRKSPLLVDATIPMQPHRPIRSLKTLLQALTNGINDALPLHIEKGTSFSPCQHIRYVH